MSKTQPTQKDAEHLFEYELLPDTDSEEDETGWDEEDDLWETPDPAEDTQESESAAKTSDYDNDRQEPEHAMDAAEYDEEVRELEPGTLRSMPARCASSAPAPSMCKG